MKFDRNNSLDPSNLHNSFVTNNSCVTDTHLILVITIEELEATDKSLYVTKNFNISSMQEILTLENTMAFADVSPKQYEAWVRQSHEVVRKIHQLEHQGPNQAAKIYLKHDGEVAPSYFP